MGVGDGESIDGAGSIKTASMTRGIGLGFEEGACAKTWVLARKGRRKTDMLVVRITCMWGGGPVS